MQQPRFEAWLTALVVLTAAPACGGKKSDTTGESHTTADAGDASLDVAVPSPDAAVGAPDVHTWDGRYPDVPEGYPPAECMPPCIWAALLGCGVPDLVQSSCIWEPQGQVSRLGWVGTVCSEASPARARNFSASAFLDFEYLDANGSCLKAVGGGNGAAMGYPLSRKYLDRAGNVIAEDFPLGEGPGTQPVLYCHEGGGSIVAYPYMAQASQDPGGPWADPACEPWLPYMGYPAMHFFIVGRTQCQSGTCSPTPMPDPPDAAADASRATEDAGVDAP